MTTVELELNRRILVIDDNRAIHDDFRKILGPRAASSAALDEAEAELFGAAVAPRVWTHYEIESAYQGEEGLDLVRKARDAQRPYALAFVDVRMPPGIDGVETTAKIWEIDPDLQVVICTAYSDHSWESMLDTIGRSDRMVVLKKPFDTVEVLQLAQALTEKWRLLQASKKKMDQLEQRYASLVNSIDGVVWEMDAHTLRFSFVSPQAERLLGYAAGRWLTEPTFWTDHLHPDDREWAVSFCRDAVAKRQPHQFEYRMRAADGRAVWVRDVASVIEEPDHGVKLRGIMMDVTERKQLQEQSFQSRKLQAVATLAGGVAHEFNNLMTVIVGHNEMMQLRLPAFDGLQRHTNEIQDAAERISKLVEQLLSFGRNQMLEPVILDLNIVATGADKLLASLIGEKIELRSIVRPRAGLVKADATRLEQVIVSLAMNACDAMPEGGTLTIETGPITLATEYAQHAGIGAGDYVMLAVSDTGGGMTAENRERVFDPFFTTKSVGQGTGLGLASCYGVIKQSGGHISVESEPGKGTTFRIYLPRFEPPGDARATAETTVPSGGMDADRGEDDRPLV